MVGKRPQPKRGNLGKRERNTSSSPVQNKNSFQNFEESTPEWYFDLRKAIRFAAESDVFIQKLSKLCNADTPNREIVSNEELLITVCKIVDSMIYEPPLNQPVDLEKMSQLLKKSLVQLQVFSEEQNLKTSESTGILDKNLSELAVETFVQQFVNRIGSSLKRHEPPAGYPVKSENDILPKKARVETVDQANDSGILGDFSVTDKKNYFQSNINQPAFFSPPLVANTQNVFLPELPSSSTSGLYNALPPLPPIGTRFVTFTDLPFGTSEGMLKNAADRLRTSVDKIAKSVRTTWKLFGFWINSRPFERLHPIEDDKSQTANEGAIFEDKEQRSLMRTYLGVVSFNDENMASAVVQYVKSLGTDVGARAATQEEVALLWSCEGSEGTRDDLLQLEDELVAIVSESREIAPAKPSESCDGSEETDLTAFKDRPRALYRMQATFMRQIQQSEEAIKKMTPKTPEEKEAYKAILQRQLGFVRQQQKIAEMLVSLGLDSRGLEFNTTFVAHDPPAEQTIPQVDPLVKALRAPAELTSSSASYKPAFGQMLYMIDVPEPLPNALVQLILHKLDIAPEHIWRDIVGKEPEGKPIFGSNDIAIEMKSFPATMAVMKRLDCVDFQFAGISFSLYVQSGRFAGLASRQKNVDETAVF